MNWYCGYKSPGVPKRSLSKHSPSPVLLNFSDQMGTGVSNKAVKVLRAIHYHDVFRKSSKELGLPTTHKSAYCFRFCNTFFYSMAWLLSSLD